MNLSSLKQFLEEKCDPEDAHEIIKWVHSEKAKSVIDHELKGFDQDDVTVDSDKIFNRILTKIKAAEAENEPFVQNSADLNPDHTLRTNKWIAVAAGVAILVSTLWVGLYLGRLKSSDLLTTQDETQFITKSTGVGQKLTVSLTDGSKVKLNSGSSITYKKDDFGNNRIVELKGEAYFDVTKDESRPFIVKVNEMEVKVLGTSFIIDARETVNKRLVAVRSGKVEVRNLKNGATIQLGINEMSSVSADEVFSKQNIDNPELVFGWTENKLVFNNSDFEEVLFKISNWFGYEFEIETNVDEFDNLTGVYNNPTLNEVLESLSYAYKFKYEIKGKKILIE